MAYGMPAIPPAMPQQQKAAKGRGGKKQGGRGQKGKGGGRENDGGKDGQAAPGGSAETVRVGRIVGFWPNYTITYDEVPATGQPAGGGQKKQGQKKAKGKAAPKSKAVEDEAA